MLRNFLGGLLRGGTRVPQVSGVRRVGGLGFRERVRTSSFTCRFFVGSNGMEKKVPPHDFHSSVLHEVSYVFW